ncbi:hypothetical protein BD311DRAFT_745623 [Dichomitus squalens]|uniref:DUF1764-domain-containing protein n=1 Tax=Dichomitus squalens TaxID=114155 RepID=A0A4Q9N3L8_9APHY|nr:hypothetical protein BD311DRAFT_745623 [Dichomitus squalens]
MPASEIDDIFASKGKLPAAAPPKASSSSALLSDKKKKKKIKDKGEVGDKPVRRKREDSNEDPAPSVPSKRKVPETVFDPSVTLPSTKSNKSKAPRVEKTEGGVPKAKKAKKDREEEDRFKDSRGTGPRRKTEEGFSIYKEDELGITDQGGDTALCPFDCQCCF